MRATPPLLRAAVVALVLVMAPGAARAVSSRHPFIVNGERGDAATTIGWGLQDESDDRPPDDLQTVDLPIQPDETMSSPEVYGEDFLRADMLGAGPLDGGAGSCYGDSGGAPM